MALIDAIETLRGSWRQVLELVSAPARGRLLDLARELVGTDGRSARRAAAGRMVRLLGDELPADHPVTVAWLADDTMRGSAAAAELDEAVDELRRVLAEIAATLGPEPAEILATAKRMLLRAPHHRPDELPAGTATTAGLLRLPVGDGVRLPAFQFGRDGRPLPVVLAVNGILRADADPWGAADWWLRGNGWLGAAPATLLGQIPDENLIAAAQGEWEED